MNMLMFFASAGAKAQQTVTFNANTTWVAPAGVGFLSSVIGRGQDGTPATPATYTGTSTTTYFGIPPNPNVVGDPQNLGIRAGSTPSDYCDPVQAFGANTQFSGYQTCYTFTFEDYAHPATTGADATGFGKTFAGGVAAPATVSTYSGISVTPGNNYPVVVPSGATIQITYFQ